MPRKARLSKRLKATGKKTYDYVNTHKKQVALGTASALALAGAGYLAKRKIDANRLAHKDTPKEVKRNALLVTKQRFLKIANDLSKNEKIRRNARNLITKIDEDLKPLKETWGEWLSRLTGGTTVATKGFGRRRRSRRSRRRSRRSRRGSRRSRRGSRRSRRGSRRRSRRSRRSRRRSRRS
jgi:hypothetical protein